MGRGRDNGMSRGKSVTVGRGGHLKFTRGSRGRGVLSNLRGVAVCSSGNLQRGTISTQNPLPTSVSRDDHDTSHNEDLWNRILPAYSHYFKTPPTLPNFEEKVAAVETFLTISTNLLECVLYFEIKSSMNPIQNSSYYPVDVELIQDNQEFCEVWPSFNDDLTTNADEVIHLWSATVHKVLLNAVKASYDKNDESNCFSTPNVAYVRVGFLRSSEVTPLSEIVSSTVGHFVTVTGVVVRTGSLQPYICFLTFRCKLCEIKFNVPQLGGILSFPCKCVSEKCSNKTLFESMEDACTTSIINSRIIRIQDALYNDGGIPKTVDCLFLGNLVNECSTSDVVMLSGVVRLISEDDFLGVQCTHRRYIEVSAIRLPNQIDRTIDGSMVSFSTSDYETINEIHNTPELFSFLVKSICPRIFGHEMVKAGLLLSLFGGRCRDGFVSRRGDINMLMIGDPGVGKSELLKTIAEISPRGIYICGNGSTSAGLTVTLTREGSDYCLDAGALVLADKGMICIDELDKMHNQHHVMLEAMEQQSITIAKAGIHRRLPARVSVFGAANPVDGHFDSTKTVFENTKISHPLLSRFDLIFVLLDKADEDTDRNLAEHILGIKISTSLIDPSPSHSNEKCNLRNKLKLGKAMHQNLLPHDLLRKYIVYARHYVHPELSSEAGELLKAYFMKMRRGNSLIHSVPPTTRLMESLVRLTEARAKIELRETATADDAKDVLELYEGSINSPFSDEINAISALAGSVKQTKKSGSKSAENFLKCLQLYAKKENRRILDLSEIRSCGKAIGFDTNIDTLIGKLNWAGELLMKGHNKYQLL